VKSFKQFLTESSVASINVKGLDLEDLIDCYKNAGYEVPKNEMKFFLDAKYEGFKNRAHSYIVMMEDDNKGGYYLTRFFLSLGPKGNVIAEPSGTPFFEDDDEDVVREKFDDLG
jgi:hypothetical protein